MPCGEGGPHDQETCSSLLAPQSPRELQCLRQEGTGPYPGQLVCCPGQGDSGGTLSLQPQGMRSVPQGF